MTQLFADACFWIALLNRADQLHSIALQAATEHKNSHLLTTDEVLTEVLSYYSGRGTLRSVACSAVIDIRNDANVEVVPQSRETFDAGLSLYRSRMDKAYSLTDCVSFYTMRIRGISDALTDDQHFVQEGFHAILRKTGK